MVEELRQEVMGGAGSAGAGKTDVRGKRFLAAISFDLVFVPFGIGFLAGLILFNAPDWLRVVLLVILNIAWVVAKDLNFSMLSPGKRMAGLKVVSAGTGAAISLKQAFLRNILLIIPLVLFFGYFIEAGMLLFKGKRLGDIWAGTDVVEA